jgi:hypothetical protein
MSTPSITPSRPRRQARPILPPPVLVGETVGDLMVRRLAQAIHRERWITYGTDDQAAHFDALPAQEQFAIEGVAVRVIREADPVARAVAKHKAAEAIGITVEQFADALAAYTRHLQD